jgi:[ribosomal protein S5]-alanine N-acetyltransferase
VADLVLKTARMELIAATPEIARADVSDVALFADLISARVPSDWPPAEFADAQSIFARYLERSPELSGWLHWYWVLRSEGMLIGNGGFGGRPDANGKVEIGFSVVDSYHGRGLATEAVGALLIWAMGQPGVKKIVAATFEDNHASRRVLQKCGFKIKCPGENSGTVEYELTM